MVEYIVENYFYLWKGERTNRPNGEGDPSNDPVNFRVNPFCTHLEGFLSIKCVLYHVHKKSFSFKDSQWNKIKKYRKGPGKKGNPVKQLRNSPKGCAVYKVLLNFLQFVYLWKTFIDWVGVWFINELKIPFGKIC